MPQKVILQVWSEILIVTDENQFLVEMLSTDKKNILSIVKPSSCRNELSIVF